MRSPYSRHMFSVSRGTSNGNSGVIGSVIWLVVSTGFCLPWLVGKHPSGKAYGGEARPVAWIIILAANLIMGATSTFSLWFRKSTLSTTLLFWGVGAIVATYLMGSFAMLPAVATMCCCAPGICSLGATNTGALDEDFCRINPNICMETNWSLWCYYGGILLAMISIVLLVNGLARHHKILVATELQQAQALKAALEARRTLHHGGYIWDEEIFDRAIYAPRRGVGIRTNSNKQPAEDRSFVTPVFQSPASDIRREKKLPAMPSAPQVRTEPEDVEVEGVGLANSMPRPRGEFSIGAYNGMSDNRSRGNNVTEKGRTRSRSWGARTPTNGDVGMRWAADEEQGGGTITPRTALRFKTSAIARAMHN